MTVAIRHRPMHTRRSIAHRRNERAGQHRSLFVARHSAHGSATGCLRRDRTGGHDRHDTENAYQSAHRQELLSKETMVVKWRVEGTRPRSVVVERGG
jgi:hypothetical protein